MYCSWRLGKKTDWCAASLVLILAQAVSAQWQTAQLLNATSEAGADCKNPKVIGSKNGGFHAVWASNASQLRYRRYTTSLQSPVTAANVFHFNPWLAESLNGDIHVVYEDWAGDTPEVGWVRSTNGGSSFSTPTEISATSGQAKYPMVSAYGTGTASDAVMSYWNASNKDLRFRRWNGSSWAADTYIGSDGGSEYEVFGIARSLLDGSVYRGFDNGDWVAVRRYNGSSWESAINLYNQGFFARQRVAVNNAGQVMVMWDMTFLDNNYYSIVYTPGQGVGPRQTVSSSATWGTALTAIPGTNDFYTVYAKDGASRIVGRRWSNGSWGAEENVSVGLTNDFMPNCDVSADPNGTGALYAVWEYWISGRPQIYYSIKPGGTPPSNPVPNRDSIVLNTTNLVANGTTNYTATYKVTDSSGVNDIRDIRILFNLDTGAPSTARGYLAWGQTQNDITLFGDTWTINSATGGGYWGFANANWGYQYITPVSCSTSTSGNQRTVVFTFKVNTAWGTAGPATGNYISLWARDSAGNTGWERSSNLFGYTFNVAPAAGAISGTVTSGGVGLAGATVSTNVGGYSTTTNSTGQYMLTNVTPGTYNVTASKTGYNPATVNNVSVASGATTSNVNFSLTAQPGSISGTVTASGGGAISEATVSTNIGGYSATTNASGQYTLTGVTPGTYNVTASKSGYIAGTVNGVVVNPGAATTGVNFALNPSTPTNYLANGNMEGGFWSTGWGGGSALPNGWDGWYNPGDFNCFQESSVKHGGSYSARTTISSGGNPSTGGNKRGIVQYVDVPPNSSFTITVWARHTNGNCPSIMAWNPGGDSNPHNAFLAGRYKWVTTDNWGQLNTWVSNTLSGTSDSTGVITVIVGGAHHGGGGSGTVYVDDVTVTVP